MMKNAVCVIIAGAYSYVEQLSGVAHEVGVSLGIWLLLELLTVLKVKIKNKIKNLRK